MGTTQSKKRWKDVQKKERGPVASDNTLLPPRSASMDVLHSPGITASPSATCPLCPHCRFTASWSSDRALTNSLCLQHNMQGNKLGVGGGGGSVLTKDMFQSCPECLQSGTTSKLLSYSSSSSQPYHNRLCEISNQDYDEMSTMSLNRKIPVGKISGDFNSNDKTGGIVQSKSEEFSDFSRVLVSKKKGQHSQTKENVYPNFCTNSNSDMCISENLATLQKGKFGDDDNRTRQPFLTAAQQSTSRELVSRQRNAGINRVSLSMVDSSTSVDNCNIKKETKSSLSLLEDEETVMSRWVRRKQMAQELRNLRMHLQQEEESKHQTNSNSSKNTSIGYKPYSICNDNIDPENDRIVNESFTSTTTQTFMEASSFSDSKQYKELSNFTTSKDSVSRGSTSADGTTTSATITTTSPSRRSIRSKFSKLSNYRYLDNHPVMTRLQNEQNNRLELMERRMEEIRISAMQEAERRRFAEIFPAKDKDSETQKLMREARESLERMKEEKRKKTLSAKDQQPCQHQYRHQNQFRASSAPPRSDWGTNADSHSPGQEDAGEIIPVIHVLSSSRETSSITSPTNRSQKKTTSLSEKNNRNNKKSIWSQGDWPDINLGKPLTWLWLPFMLFPLVLRMLLSMLFTSMAAPTTPRNGNSVSNTGLSYADRNRNFSRDKRKKSC